MVAMDVQMDNRSSQFLLEQAKKFPNEVRRAFYYSCGITLRIMRGRMSGKNKHIEKWSDFTREWRQRANTDTGTVFGGRLMWPDGKLLTMKPEGDRCRIGWVGQMEEAARTFQNGGTQPTEPSWRHRLYKYHGYKPGEVPRIAVTPERPVVAQSLESASKNVTSWTLGAFEKVLQRRIKGWTMKYYKNKGTEMGARAASRAASAATAARRVQIYMSDQWVSEA